MKNSRMMNQWTRCLLAALALGAFTGAQAQQGGGETEKAVVALEYQWLDADKTNNPDLAVALLADKYVSTDADGKLADKAKTEAQAKARKYTSAVYEDVKATAFGDTVIVTGGYRGKGTEDGKPFAEHLRWTDTWVKMPGGKWQCVATQYTALKK
jgi:ketosteroid isomerase-like protein